MSSSNFIQPPPVDIARTDLFGHEHFLVPVDTDGAIRNTVQWGYPAPKVLYVPLEQSPTIEQTIDKLIDGIKDFPDLKEQIEQHIRMLAKHL